MDHSSLERILRESTTDLIEQYAQPLLDVREAIDQNVADIASMCDVRTVRTLSSVFLHLISVRRSGAYDGTAAAPSRMRPPPPAIGAEAVCCCCCPRRRCRRHCRRRR